MIEIVQQHIDEIQWQQLVMKSPYSTFFQTKECYDFYCSLSFMKSFLFGVNENNELKGVICGYIIADGMFLKRYFSQRAIIYGGPLLAQDISNEALLLLLNNVKEALQNQSIYVEFRNNNDYHLFKNTFEKAGFQYEPRYNFIVETNEDIDIINSKLSNSKRRQIKKSKEFGVEIVTTKSKEDIDQFYAILSKLYKQKVKKPLFPKEFFEKLVTLPNAKLLVAKYQNRVISGMACVSLHKTAVYEWLVCGDNDHYNHLYPSVSITYGAIEFASKNGFNKFDFMGAGKPGKKYGVRDFKEKFGGKLVENGRFIMKNNRFLFDMGNFYLKF